MAFEGFGGSRRDAIVGAIIWVVGKIVIEAIGSVVIEAG